MFEALDRLRVRAPRRRCSTASPIPRPSARWALGLVELDPDDRRKATTYSKGMKQRVKVAQALVNDPAVLVLDEPLTGLDPRQRNHLIDLFGRLGDAGPVRARVEPRARRGRAVRLPRARGGPGPPGRHRRLPGHPRPHGRPPPPHPGAHRPAPRAGHRAARPRRGARRPPRAAVGRATGRRRRRHHRRAARSAGRSPSPPRPSAPRCSRSSPLDDDLDSVFRYLVQR